MRRLFTSILIFLLLLSGCTDNYSEQYNEVYDEAYEEGYAKGQSLGYDLGYEEGAIDGSNAGYDKGYYDGYDTGYLDAKYEYFCGLRSYDVKLTDSILFYNSFLPEQLQISTDKINNIKNYSYQDDKNVTFSFSNRVTVQIVLDNGYVVSFAVKINSDLVKEKSYEFFQYINAAISFADPNTDDNSRYLLMNDLIEHGYYGFEYDLKYTDVFYEYEAADGFSTFYVGLLNFLNNP